MQGKPSNTLKRIGTSGEICCSHLMNIYQPKYLQLLLVIFFLIYLPFYGEKETIERNLGFMDII